MPREKNVKRKKMPARWYIDRHLKLKDERDALVEKLKAKKREIEELEKDAIEFYDEEELVGTKTRTGLCYIEKREHVNISDWNKFSAYAIRYRLPELFQRRVSKEAYDELTTQGRSVPGVSIFEQRSFRTRHRQEAC